MENTRKPFQIWEVNGEEYKLKLKTSSIIKIYVGAMQKHSEREKEGTEC